MHVSTRIENNLDLRHDIPYICLEILYLQDQDPMDMTVC